MSKDTKFFVRPKVRFSQVSDNECKTSDSKNPVEQITTALSNKPKIRSIVNLDKPLVILKHKQPVDNLKNKDTHSVKNIRSLENLTEECCNSLHSLKIQSASTNRDSIKTYNQIPLSDTGNAANIKANFDNADKVTSSVDCLATEDEKISEILDSQKTVKTDVLKKCVRNDKGKENESSSVKRTIYSNPKKATDRSECLKGNAQRKIKSLTINSTTKKHVGQTETTRLARAPAPVVKKNAVKKSSASVKSINVKPVVMPCYKHTKLASKSKTAPIKKTVVRDIMGQKIKNYIGPGVQHKRQDHYKVPETVEHLPVKSNIMGEILAHPEYNSIMCTINKMQEIKTQKFVTDVKHLPTSYTNLINKKVSAALDFPLGEAIYKDLVDLSVDEKQLPNRLTRSKDPEPRQRDLVPVLSDFFTPISTEEYCDSVSAKPRTPESVDSWSAFRISDKIIEWKYNMDDM